MTFKLDDVLFPRVIEYMAFLNGGSATQLGELIVFHDGEPDRVAMLAPEGKDRHSILEVLNSQDLAVVSDKIHAEGWGPFIRTCLRGCPNASTLKGIA